MVKHQAGTSVLLLSCNKGAFETLSESDISFLIRSAILKEAYEDEVLEILDNDSTQPESDSV